MEKYLIINADDFGIADSVNEAIIDLLNKGLLSSATLMPNANSYKEAVSWSKKKSKNIGLHLTLVNGGSNKKISSLTKAKSLEDKEGYLYEDKLYFIKNFKFKELKKEVDEQFNKIKTDGVVITHVDTHRYSIYPTYSPLAFIYLCKKCGENSVATRWCRKGSFFVGDNIANLCDSYQASQFFASIADFYRVPIPDYVYKFPYCRVLSKYDDKKKVFIEMLKKLPVGVNEVHLHPAIDSKDIRDITDTFEERIYEYKLLLDEDIINAITDLNIKLITYTDIKDVVKNRSRIKALGNIFYYGGKYSFKILINKIRGL